MAKIQTTKNYSNFSLSALNRPIDMKAHSALKRSMEQYGFLPQFPIVCVRDENKRLIIWDGQHRFTLAQSLGLPIHWVESDTEFDVATINNGQKPWCARDYAESFASRGITSYSVLLEFCDKHHIAIGRGAALLTGNATFKACAASFATGRFKVTCLAMAESVAHIYGLIGKTNPAVKSSRLIEALMACYRVKDFDVDRMSERISKCGDMIEQHGTREAYLQMLEDVYNFKMRTTVALKFEALKALRDRNPVKKVSLSR